jgi:1,4-dihydroxy-2-naphthoate octaprenyltransferase
VSAQIFHRLRPWVLASRPQTLFASLAPVLLGTSSAYSEGLGNAAAALAALFGAVFIQIGTNLANDYWDAKKGADRAERLGPVRVTSAGLLRPRTVFLGMICCFAAASIAGLWLIFCAGWPILVIGVVSILCGILYTAGPFPPAYLGLAMCSLLFFWFGRNSRNLLCAGAPVFFHSSHSRGNSRFLLGCADCSQ